ncbi:MAG: hypothetical protein OQK79_11715 [Rhodanobacter sp.]|jgi:redox-regulated HSP33 family molecular chaperone|nr:hypothetical protein [Rhodanobacter sp.]
MSSLRTLTTSLTFGLFLVAAAPAVHAGDNGYAGMLGYLTNSRIDGQAMSGTSGSSAVNMAAGDFNQQANLRAFAVGGTVSIHSRQQQLDNVSNAPSVATASIGGSAYANGSGLASINQASGNGNAQVNAVAAVLAAQGIRESTDGGLSMVASASAGEQNPSTASGTGMRSVAVESSAMQGFQGVMQLNQAAGSGNATSNQLLLSLPTSP